MKNIWYVLLSFLITFTTYGQGKIETLKQVINQHQGDSAEVNALFSYADLLRVKNALEFKKYTDQGLALAKKIDYKKGVAEGLRRTGTHYRMQSNYDEGAKYFLKSLEIFEELKDKEGVARCYDHLGLIYQRQMINAGSKGGKTVFYEKSLEYYKKVKEIYRDIRKPKELINNYINVGVLHQFYGNLDKALQTYDVGEVMAKQNNMGGVLADLYLFKGVLLVKQKKTEQSLKVFRQSIKQYLKVGNEAGAASVYLRIGDVYQRQQKYEKAKTYFKDALAIAQKVKNKYYIISSLNRLSKLHLLTKQYDLVQESLKQSIAVSESIGNVMTLTDAYAIQIRLDSIRNNYQEAFKHQTRYYQLKDSVFNARKNLQLTEMLTRFDSQKKENENQLLRKENELKQETIKQNQTVTVAIGAILLLTLVSAVVFLRTNQQLKKQKDEVANKNEVLEKQKTEIFQQNELLKEQQSQILAQNEELQQQGEELQANKEFLEVKNSVLEQTTQVLEEQTTQIKQSIRAGLMIQRAILPSNNVLKKELSDYFVLYRPRDVVSGDFYWFSCVGEHEQSQKLLLAAVDCTGHGIQGAFMSMIGYILLDRIVEVERITDPAKILNRLAVLIAEALHQKESDRADGMDIALVLLENEAGINEVNADKKQVKVTYAGAKRPLLFVRNPQSSEAITEEIKGQKRWIGGVPSERASFENQILRLHSGDMFYLTTDGYSDQNDKKRRGFKTQNLKRVLQQNAHKDLTCQQKALDKALDQHMEGTTQRDDILIWGIKV